MKKKFVNYQNNTRKIAIQLKEKNKVYLLIKNLKIKKRIRNLTLLRLDHFLL